jgi:hypothetical protein
MNTYVAGGLSQNECDPPNDGLLKSDKTNNINYYKCLDDDIDVLGWAKNRHGPSSRVEWRPPWLAGVREDRGWFFMACLR